jgi:FkbM family methyltransferase
MRRQLAGAISRALGKTPIGYLPVRVRAGLAKGARWTLLPFSSYWRHGESELDVRSAISYFPTLEGLVFWDCGAHFGIHSVGMSMQVGPNGQVVAFEPDPGAARRLRYHVEANRLSNVRVIEAAASRTIGAAELFLPAGKGSAVSHLRFHEADKMAGVDSIGVATVAPDGLVSDGEIRLPDLIKIDVQGHGADAVAGAMDSIRKKLPIIAFSNHSDVEMAGVRGLLEPLSYRPVRFDGSSCSWGNFTEALLVPGSRLPCRK